MARGFRRRDFLRTASVGLLGVGSGCGALQANSRWTVDLGGLPSRFPAVADDGFAVTSSLTSDSELGWVTYSGKYEQLTSLSRIMGSPVLHGDSVYIDAEGVIHNVPLDGSALEAYSTSYLTFGRFPPVATDSRLYSTGYSGKLGKRAVFALDFETRRIAWLRPFGAAHASLDTDGDRVFAASRAGVVRAYDATDGATLWKRKIDRAARVAHYDGTVYVASDGGMTALNPPDGRAIWRTESNWIASVGTIPQANDSMVYAIMSFFTTRVRTRLATETYLVAYDRTTGEERWRTRAKFGTPLSVTADTIAIESVEQTTTSDGEKNRRERLSLFGIHGARKRRYELSGRATMKPIIRDRLVIVGDDQTLVAHER